MNRILLVLALLLYADGASAQTRIPAIVSDIVSQKDSSGMGGQELDEVVIVSTTRSTRTIANLPTRVEVIGGGEVDEKNNMRPANVSMLLHESTGMQVQQTSATSGAASIRIQGLDGRYTQLLKDGYPNYGNFSGGLSILEIPPLDLMRVEIIKGPASTLYGAGAIAGVVNFISRTPGSRPAYNAIINQSHVGQTNLGGFAARRWKKVGYTMLALFNNQLPYDVDHDDFTELPKAADLTLHPKLFLYPDERTVIAIGNSFTVGERTGGDINLIRHGSSSHHTFFEQNNSLRNVATLAVSRGLRNEDQLSMKCSYSYFKRRIEVPAYVFEGASRNLFAELTYLREKGAHTLIAGVNFISDAFQEHKQTSPRQRDFRTTTAGVFAQHTWDAAKWFKLESGLRADAVRYGNSLYHKSEVVLLPRISGLFIWNTSLSSRIGGGFGYKTPTLFTEQTESFQYQNLLPLSNVKASAAPAERQT